MRNINFFSDGSYCDWTGYLIDLQHALDKLFTFKRDIPAAYGEMMNHPLNQVSSQFFNVVLIDRNGNFPNVCMTAPVMIDTRQGTEITVYAYDREIRTTGPGLRVEYAPQSFCKIPDCEYGYYGMKLNVLAYLSGRRVDRLSIVDLYNGQTTKAVMFKPNIATDFIKWAIKINQPEEAPEPTSKSARIARFAQPAQPMLFS